MLLAADNIRITNKMIYRALMEMDPMPIQKMVVECKNAGADVIDINSGPLSRDAEKKITFFIEAVQSVTDLPLLIDTANPSVIEAALKASKNKMIINGFSLEPDKIESILPLAEKYHTDIIGYLLYPNGHVPPDRTERMNVSVELYSEAIKAGLDSDQLIIDPIVAPITWQDGKYQNLEILHVLQLLPELLGFPVRTIAGLSNLTSGLKDVEIKILLEKTFLPMLAASGLSIVLLNIFHSETIRIARTSSSLTDSKLFSPEISK